MGCVLVNMDGHVVAKAHDNSKTGKNILHHAVMNSIDTVAAQDCKIEDRPTYLYEAQHR